MQSSVFDGVLRAIREQVLPHPEWRQDQRAPNSVLNDQMLRRIFRFTTPQTEAAFNRMHKEVMKARNRSPDATARLQSDLAKRIHDRLTVPGIDRGLDGVVAMKRSDNVQLIKSVQVDMLDDLRQVLEETEGLSIPDIENALLARGNVPLSRVNLIARDQTLKLNSGITQHRCQAAGLNRYTWSTSQDERVRPMHADLEGQVFSWDSPPVTNDQGDRNSPGEDYQCFPGDSEVQFADGVTKAFRRWYSGELSAVVLASGKTIRATPNHPVLTRRGWVPIGLLKEGDDVVEISQEALAPREHNEDHRPPAFRDLFASLAVRGRVRSMGGKPADFHGDGSEGHVDVACATRGLSVGMFPHGSESLEQFCLAEAGSSTASKLRAARALFERALRSAHRFIRASGDLLSFLAGSPGEAKDIRATAAAKLDPRTLEPIRQRLSRQPDAIGDGEYALPCLIGRNDGGKFDTSAIRRRTHRSSVRLDADSPEFLAQVVNADAEERGQLLQGLPFVQQFARVISVDRLPFSGHVYNLETAPGWYAVDGVIAHNCRCVGCPILEGDEGESSEAAEEEETDPADLAAEE